MNPFYINIYRREDTEGGFQGTHTGWTTIEFTADIVVLHDCYSYSDTDGDTRFEGTDDDIIIRIDIERIVSLIPAEYKNKSILAEYNLAYNYCDDLESDSERKFFMGVLHYYKKDRNFDTLVKIMQENDIPCQHHQTRWN